MDDLKKNLIKAIQTAPSDDELSEYLFKIAKKLKPRAFEDSTVTMRRAMLELLDAKAESLDISLQSQKFSKLSEFFSLTPGLHIIAAPSGHGKTFWSMQWAEEAASAGHEVLVLSLEMSSVDLSARCISGLSDIPLSILVRKKISETQRDLLVGIATDESLSYLDRIHIDSVGDYDWIKIFPRLWDRMLKLKPKLVIIDYIQMIYDSDESDSRVSRVLSDVARELKLFAENTKSAVILLSQMNREALKETRRMKWADFGFVPLSHEFVKESGGIVEAADSVQLICIPERFPVCPPEFKNRFQVIVDKNRRLGELGVCLFDFDNAKMRFTS